ncbi:MAG: chemotaxis response regulator protein-glutamate methylesterase [Desulfobulbaceae bacterium]|nr:chemotaxis response regulator protein-glutamate methylesterase [Desulfobulbaceae bacterium]
MKIKVLVVDDTIFYRKIISDILETFADVEVIGTANNGKIALSRIKHLKPDLLTLDIEMPEMSGLQVLEAIQRQDLATDCLILSSKTRHDSVITLQALELGAFDFIAKPDEKSPEENRKNLARQLRLAFKAYGRSLELRKRYAKPGAAKKGAPLSQKIKKVAAAVKTAGRTRQRTEKSKAIAIGISTGGPKALAAMVPQLKGDIGVPIFVAQHMPEMFTASLAGNLDSKSALTVKEAENGEQVRSNTVYIAPGGKQMKVASGAGLAKIIRITNDPPENNCRPSVDYLFRSIAREYGAESTCVVMTGMGVDGKLGLTVAKASGTFAIAQHEESCVVYGMPKAVVDANLADVIAPLDRIAHEIMKTL